MALQGTIDAFPLTDVLQLLSSSSKSGRLSLEGDRGRLELWIEQGSVVGGSVGAPDAPRSVFELLRFADGSFTFDVTDAAPPVPVEPMQLEQCLAAATELLSEWRRIEQVVPSMRHRVAPTPSIAEPVTLSPEDWVVLTNAGDLPVVAELARRLDLDEFGCGAALADLVERDLMITLEPLAEHAPEPVDSLDAHVPLAAVEPERPEADTEADRFPEHFPIDDLLGTDEPDAPAWNDEQLEGTRFAAAQTFEPLGVDPFADAATAGDPRDEASFADRTAEAWDEVVAGGDPLVEEPWQELPADTEVAEPVDDGTDEVLRQMSRLSPKAAEAIAAALTTPADAASVAPAGSDAERRDNDGPVSFLGSF